MARLSQATLNGANFTNAAFATSPGSWSFTDQDGLPYSISYGPAIFDPLATTQCICPDGAPGGLGGCSGARLTPHRAGPFPPTPTCVPSPTAWCPRPSG